MWRFDVTLHHFVAFWEIELSYVLIPLRNITGNLISYVGRGLEVSRIMKMVTCCTFSISNIFLY